MTDPYDPGHKGLGILIIGLVVVLSSAAVLLTSLLSGAVCR